jgi:hypothetical protein
MTEKSHPAGVLARAKGPATLLTKEKRFGPPKKRLALILGSDKIDL